jgi:predicted chitinase
MRASRRPGTGRDRNLNRWADLGDFETLTAQINPAKLGLVERTGYWKRGVDALS